MESVNFEQRSSDNFVRQVGRSVVGICAAYAGLKLGQEIFNFDMPYYMEIGVATATHSATTKATANH